MIYIGLGGTLGSIVRYLFYKMATQLTFTSLVGTFICNALGSFLAGLLLLFIKKDSPEHNFFIIGFLGSFTTFSTFSLDCLKLLQEKKLELFIKYSFCSILTSLSLCYMGYLLGSRIIKISFEN
jgi:fluoride exporter